MRYCLQDITPVNDPNIFYTGIKTIERVKNQTMCQTTMEDFMSK